MTTKRYATSSRFDPAFVPVRSFVAASAALLVNRLLAVRAIGQLDAELQGLGTEENWLTS